MLGSLALQHQIYRLDFNFIFAKVDFKVQGSLVSLHLYGPRIVFQVI